MTVRVACQHCDATYQVREDKLGKNVRCQKCGKTFVTSQTPTAEELNLDLDLPPAEPVKPEEHPTGISIWKILGTIAAVFLFSLIVGWVYAPAGLFLMMGGSLSGIGLIFFGIARLFLAMDGRQRVWMTLKILLRFVGLKLFYVDASLYNRKTMRALAWMGIGFLLMFSSLFSTPLFVSKTREVVQDEIDKTQQQMDEIAQNDDHGFAGNQQSDPFGGPGQMPPPAFGPGVPTPGFGPPPGFNPAGPPGAFPSGKLPIKFFYESFDHPRSEIPARVDERFKSFKFYILGTVRIDETRQLIEFIASDPPDQNETAEIREAYTEAGVKLRPRKTDPR